MLQVLKFNLFKQKIACLDTGIVRATGSDGIIEFDTAATPANAKTCAISLFSIYDDKKIEFKCTNIASNVKINVSILLA
jgi:hypothetical protein